MATSTPTPPPIAERADIHKSCKSLETLLNVVNEYCEAFSVIVSLQKKLAKVLRETAALKVTGEIAGNAFHASANIFEALSEIDAKYTKVVDKEYDGISVEVKKWFKRLVKEEKAHDERIENANAKIKQASQSYEKKTKKKAADVSEEHARYINLISTLGPEISQEKYNHALNVTQKHIMTTFNVAACLARIADTEWLKVCEGVRRFAPTIGTLSQWRVLCEAGWGQPLPEGIPELTTDMLKVPEGDERAPPLSPVPPRYTPTAPYNEPLPTENIQPPPSPGRSPAIEQTATQTSVPPPFRGRSPAIEQTTTQTSVPPPSPGRSPGTQQMPPPTSSASPPSPGRSVEGQQKTNQTSIPPPPSAFDTLKQPFFDPVTGSVRTLSAFPAPPTHFPIPPPRLPIQQQSTTSMSHSSQSSLSTPTSNFQLTESPVSSAQVFWASSDAKRDAGSTSSQPSQRSAHPPSPEQKYYQPPSTKVIEESTPSLDIHRPLPVRANVYPSLQDIREDPNHPSSGRNESIPGQWTESTYEIRHATNDFDGEFGVNRRTDQSSKTWSYDALRSRGVERTDTGASSGSLVAAMRTRYSNNPESTSPQPREFTRVPLSVTNLASKYESNANPISSKARASSPPIARQQSLPVDAIRPKQGSSEHLYPVRISHRPGQNSIATSTPTIEEDSARQRRSNDDHDLRERQRELLERERDIEARARELERERARLANLREAVGSTSPGGKMTTVPEESHGNAAPRSTISPLRPRRISLRKQLQRPLSQMELEDEENHISQRPRSSSNQSANGSGGSGVGQAQSQPQLSPTRLRNPEEHRENRYGDESQPSPHAPYCGCDTCSVSKYRAPSMSTTNLNTSSQDSSKSQVSSSGNLLRPPVSSEKPKSGWMRRLSMPGGLSSAFSLDSKRNSAGGAGNYALGSGVSSANASKALLPLDGKKNTSSTSLLGGPNSSRAQEDGWLAGGNEARRSYEANRSMTNLALGSRR